MAGDTFPFPDDANLIPDMFKSTATAGISSIAGVPTAGNEAATNRWPLATSTLNIVSGLEKE